MSHKKRGKHDGKGWMPNEPTLAFLLAIKKRFDEKSTDFDRTKVIFDPPSCRRLEGQPSPEAAYCILDIGRPDDVS